MSKDNFNSVFEFLNKSFPKSEIETLNYHVADDAQFKIHFENGSSLLKVSMELLSDNTNDDLIGPLDKWEITDHLKSNIGKGSLAKTSSVSLFDRD